ncbi:MAG: electron transfer flavoprotein subunit alpha/FixB family protein [Dehalococcoidales bacterium]|nr:electron transfer flavoprotein subunit alpha/FixB family protein [Dehalococcoidales bacterium]
MSESKSVWVLIEHEEGRVEAASLETLSCGRQLADDLGGRVVALVVGDDSRELAGELASYGADDIFLLDNSRQPDYSADYYTGVLSGLIKDKSPDIFLCGATLTGRDLTPRLAARLGTGLISECVSLSINKEGRLTGTRLTHGGRISSTILCPSSGTQIATVKPGIITISRQDKTRQAETREITPEPGRSESRIRVKSVVKAAPDKISLDEAEVIVAAGKGAGSLENVQLLKEFAGRLGGVVAGSLGAVDEGWLPRKKLVGQTGTTVAPRLYIACGISGSVYHVLGMKDSGFIIAINKDRNAPIFKVADMSIIGEVTGVISAIIEELPETAGETDNNDAEAGNA